MNKETGLSHLLSEKALLIFQQSWDFKTKYTLVEGRYVYGKNGKIIRTDRQSTVQNSTPAAKYTLNEETNSENNSVDSKKGRRPKSDSSLYNEPNSTYDSDASTLTTVTNES